MSHCLGENEAKKGILDGTKDELSIYLFYPSLCDKGWQISKVYIKNAER